MLDRDHKAAVRTAGTGACVTEGRTDAWPEFCTAQTRRWAELSRIGSPQRSNFSQASRISLRKESSS
jgi:hypothetical protein